MAKYYFRGDGARVRCPFDRRTRGELATYALGMREKIREFRLEMAWFEEHPDGAPPMEARAGALRDFAAGLRANYRELRRKMEMFDEDFFGRVEGLVGRENDAPRDPLEMLPVWKYLEVMRRRRQSAGSGIPPKRGRRR